MQTIIDSFDSDRNAIISPSNIVKAAVESFPEVAVVTFSGQTLGIAAEKFGATQIDAFVAGMSYPVYRIDYSGKSFVFYFSPVGGATTAAILDEMIAKGCRKFVFYGSCGVLDRKLAAKSLIVPTAAYRDEGASYHYAPPSTYNDVPTAPRLAEIFAELELPHVCGRTWTTYAIYRETRGNMEKRRADGCVAVEMECASIMSVAQFRGADAYQFLYAADSLDSAEWDSRTFGALVATDREKYLRIALEIAVRV
jgi:uridine phosphorylase